MIATTSWWRALQCMSATWATTRVAPTRNPPALRSTVCAGVRGLGTHKGRLYTESVGAAIDAFVPACADWARTTVAPTRNPPALRSTRLCGRARTGHAQGLPLHGIRRRCDRRVCAGVRGLGTHKGRLYTESVGHSMWPTGASTRVASTRCHSQLIGAFLADLLTDRVRGAAGRGGAEACGLGLESGA